MLRKLRDCSHKTQAEIARSGFLVPSSLSNHLNGGRIPEEPQVEAFFNAILKDLKSSGADLAVLPCSLGELLELRRLARVQHCACVPHDEEANAPSTTDGPPALPVSRPAADLVGRPLRPWGRQPLQRRAVSRHVLRRASARPQLPVPLPEGDRQRAVHSDAAEWTELETLLSFLTDGRHRDAGLLLWRAGRTLSPAELLEAVGSCRAVGQEDAAEAVLASVSERADKQAVLNIAAAFQHAGRTEDVAFLLAAARAS
ncbi:hypothetical protein EF912_26920 [Streptomyces sp. WAC07061]|uniref:hypothetical protein n=1 Tax=Streptomyces sp. WAC07061 TaxID=2487410 RepID=UPI000F792E9A|nr:hypothetical protein [Streptomyces sp. WAC07061]RSS47263.1 hypothetical protein EF912_26920 [Streptomyces sp. WAC07061]